jgi:hypothetical protein
MRSIWPLPLIAALLCPLSPLDRALAADRSNEAVIQEFVQQEDRAKLSQLDKQQAETRKKHQVLFLMGLALLISILTTAGLGIAMAVYGKQVFIPHMVMAGISVTLAIVHAVVAIVWFYPF